MPTELAVSTETVRSRIVGTGVAVALYTLTAVALSYPSVSQLTTSIPGAGGDPYLNLWTLQWVAHAAPDGWSSLWDANIFFATPDTLAYSESMLPTALVHWLVSGITGSTTLAFNLVYVGAWASSGVLTFQVARRLGATWSGALVAGLIYQLAVPRLVHYGHFQLVVGGALVPLVVLLVLRVVDRPGPARGFALGAGTALVVLCSTYHGVMIAIALSVFFSGWLLAGGRRSADLTVALLVGAATAIVVVLPVAVEYSTALEGPHFDREPTYAARPGDFLALGADHHLLADLPPFDHFSGDRTRSVENRLFPGVVALGAGSLGFVRVVRGRRAGNDPSRANAVLLWLSTAGIVLLVLAFGDEIALVGATIPLPFSWMHDHLPGFGAIRAPSRFVTFPLFVLALFASRAVPAWPPERARTAPLVGLALGAVVVAETAFPITVSEVPRSSAAEAVNHELAERDASAVLELPIGDTTVWTQPLVETPRMVLATIDWRPRVGGASGYVPPGYVERVATLRTFPSDAALSVVDELGVTTVVLRLDIPGPLPSGLEGRFRRDGVARFTRRSAEEIVAGIPSSRLRSVDELGDALLVELHPPPGSD